MKSVLRCSQSVFSLFQWVLCFYTIRPAHLDPYWIYFGPIYGRLFCPSMISCFQNTKAKSSWGAYRKLHKVLHISNMFTFSDKSLHEQCGKLTSWVKCETVISNWNKIYIHLSVKTDIGSNWKLKQTVFCKSPLPEIQFKVTWSSPNYMIYQKKKFKA